jgi:hypothetical protein
MIKIKIKHCSEADEEHAASFRQYAHTFHYPNIICVAKAFWKLPEGYLMGILAHEIGHILSDGKGGEEGANREMYKRYGIHIQYVDSEYGRNLEYISKEDIRTIFNRINIIF